MNLFYRSRHLLAVLAMAFAFGLVTADFADARRGGSFGSRGFRTFQSPPATNTAPRTTAPIDRSMTPNSQATQPGAAQRTGAQTQAQQRPGGFFGGGFAGSMMRGLLVGGLIGLLLGHGLGGMAGFLGLLLQGALLVGGIMLLMHFLRRRQAPAMAGAGAPMSREMMGSGRGEGPLGSSVSSGVGAGLSGLGGVRDVQPSSGAQRGPTDEIGIGQEDLDTFERLLSEIQAAFGAEDYAGLRERTTPEIMSYFAEEPGQNASKGMRNEVRDVRLLQGDLAESWREGDTDYATVAMRYESVDALRERETGRIVAGNDAAPSEMTEVWTFRRDRGASWKLSAIQEA